MSIIFVGQNKLDFQNPRVAFDNSNVNAFDSDFVRGYLEIVSNTTPGLDSPFPIDLRQIPIGKVSIHMELYTQDNVNDNRLDGSWFSIYDNGGNLIGRVDHEAGLMRAQTFNGNTSASGGSITLLPSVKYQLDFTIEVTALEITLEIFINKISESVAVIANDNNYGNTDQIYFDFEQIGFGSSFNDFIRFSQVIVTDNDDSTINKKLGELVKTADGAFTDFSQGFASVSDNDLLTLSAANAAGDRQSWQEGFTAPSGNRQIQSLIRVSSNPSFLELPELFSQGVVIGGVEYYGAAKAFPFLAPSVDEFLTNPATGTQWEFSEITDAADFEGVIRLE